MSVTGDVMRFTYLLRLGRRLGGARRPGGAAARTNEGAYLLGLGEDAVQAKYLLVKHIDIRCPPGPSRNPTWWS